MPGDKAEVMEHTDHCLQHANAIRQHFIHVGNTELQLPWCCQHFLSCYKYLVNKAFYNVTQKISVQQAVGFEMLQCAYIVNK